MNKTYKYKGFPNYQFKDGKMIRIAIRVKNSRYQFQYLSEKTMNVIEFKGIKGYRMRNDKGSYVFKSINSLKKIVY